MTLLVSLLLFSKRKVKGDAGQGVSLLNQPAGARTRQSESISIMQRLALSNGAADLLGVRLMFVNRPSSPIPQSIESNVGP